LLSAMDFRLKILLTNYKNTDNMKTSTVSNSISNSVSITVLIVLILISAGLYLLKVIGIPLLVIMVVISILIGSSIQIADQWEKAIVLRMGKFNG
jgi:hypothetical protein